MLSILWHEGRTYSRMKDDEWGRLVKERKRAGRWYDKTWRDAARAQMCAVAMEAAYTRLTKEGERAHGRLEAEYMRILREGGSMHGRVVDFTELNEVKDELAVMAWRIRRRSGGVSGTEVRHSRAGEEYEEARAKCNQLAIHAVNWAEIVENDARRVVEQRRKLLEYKEGIRMM